MILNILDSVQFEIVSLITDRTLFIAAQSYGILTANLFPRLRGKYIILLRFAVFFLFLFFVEICSCSSQCWISFP